MISLHSMCYVFNIHKFSHRNFHYPKIQAQEVSLSTNSGTGTCTLHTCTNMEQHVEVVLCVWSFFWVMKFPVLTGLQPHNSIQEAEITHGHALDILTCHYKPWFFIMNLICLCQRYNSGLRNFMIFPLRDGSNNRVAVVTIFRPHN